MPTVTLRNATPDDYPVIVTLNHDEVAHTSEMDIDRLGVLAQLTVYLKVAVVDEQVVAFLMVMQQDADYQNDNFLWFQEQFSRYWYIDRIVVDSAHASLKIGSTLYADLMHTARANGAIAVTCEYNIQPPNLISARFHKKWGFTELGTQWVAGGSKQVSLQAVQLDNI